MVATLRREELEGVEKTVRKAVKQRNAAREKKRFDVADEIRSALEAMGVEVEDSSATTSEWRWKAPPAVEEDQVKKARKRVRFVEKEPEEEPEAKKKVKTAPKTLKLDGGVVARVLRVGDGDEARRHRSITVKYSGVLAKTGKRFDAGTIAFKLGAGEVIKGWDVGCLGMKLGEKRRLTIPPKMAYGARGAPPDIPKNATLVFDVALLKA